MSHFDALLDFEDQPVTNGTTKHNDMSDFDPFGSTSPMEPKGGAGGDLLVDFSGNSEVVTNGSTEGDILQLDISTSNDTANPLFDLSSPEKKSLNEPVNPLYDLKEQPEILSPQKETVNASADFLIDDSFNGTVDPLCDFSENNKSEAKMDSISNDETTDITLSNVHVSVDSKDADVNYTTSIDGETNGKDINGDVQNEALINCHKVHENGDQEVETKKPETNEPSVDFVVESVDVVLEEKELQKDNVDNSEASFEQNNEILIEQTDEILLEQTPSEVKNDVSDENVEKEQSVSEEQDDIPHQEPIINEEDVKPTESEKTVVENEVVPAQELIYEVQESQKEETSPQNEEVDIQVTQNTETSPQNEEVDIQVIQNSETSHQNGEVDIQNAETSPQNEEIVIQQAVQKSETSPEVQSSEQNSVVENIIEQPSLVDTVEESTTIADEQEEQEIKRGGKTVSKTKEESSYTEVSGDVRTGLQGASLTGSYTDAQGVHTVKQDMSSGMTGSGMQQNGVQAVPQDPNITRSTDQLQEDYSLESGYSKNLAAKFQSGAALNQTEVKRLSVAEDLQGVEAGVYENEPPRLTKDVVRSVDLSQENLPEHGRARNIKDRFQQMGSETSSKGVAGKREITPDRTGRVEFVSEPRGHFEGYEGRSETGVFESQPVYNPNVVRHGEVETTTENLPERGTAKNLASRFTNISSSPSQSTGAPRGKREITPDRTGRVEFVSEPRGKFESYEGRAEAGVFESQPVHNPNVVKADLSSEDLLPEKGFAKSVVSRFREGAVEQKEVRRGPRPITPPREEAVVYESQPAAPDGVVRSEDYLQEALPEQGFAKNIVSRFKQLESSSGENTPRNKKEFTPPREDPRIQPNTGECGVYENEPKVFKGYKNKLEHGVRENQPRVRDDVVRESDLSPAVVGLPEQGSTRSLLSKWRQTETSSHSPSSSTTPVRRKEFTPPRDEPLLMSPRSPAYGGQSVHPNDLPGQYHEHVQAGVSENEPMQLAGVAREADTDWTDGMPKEGSARNVLARFKQFQSEVAQNEAKSVPKKKKVPTATLR